MKKYVVQYVMICRARKPRELSTRHAAIPYIHSAITNLPTFLAGDGLSKVFL